MLWYISLKKNLIKICLVEPTMMINDFCFNNIKLACPAGFKSFSAQSHLIGSPSARLQELHKSVNDSLIRARSEVSAGNL